jgi:hypothetical protein
MVGTNVSLTNRVVGAFAAIVGVAVVGHSMMRLIEAMAAASTVVFVMFAAIAMGATMAIVGTMLVFGSVWARTAGTVVFPVNAVFCALQFGVTGGQIWAVAAGSSVVFFVLLLSWRPPESVDVDEDTSGIWVGTTH